MDTANVYTTGDVARFCGVRKMTVVRWIERGELPAYQLPGRGDRRIARKDVLEFMTRNGFPLPEDLVGDDIDVLIIDDDQNAAKAIKRTLSVDGYRVKVANDGFRAGSMIEIYKPRMITLDLAMPGMSGFEVLTYIRQRSSLDGMKVLVISALPKNKLDQAIAAGADYVLMKPFTNSELSQLVQSALNIPLQERS